MAKLASNTTGKSQTAAWVDVAKTSKSTEVLAMVEQLAKANKVAKAARESLEAKIVAVIAVPKGKKLAFAYRFGPAWAIVDDDGEEKKATAKVKAATPDYGY